MDTFTNFGKYPLFFGYIIKNCKRYHKTYLITWVLELLPPQYRLQLDCNASDNRAKLTSYIYWYIKNEN